MKVRVHMNLHKKCFSMSLYEKGKGWRVWTHCDDFMLRDVEFKVSPAGNKRARESGVRNVHAYAYGILAHHHMFGNCKLAFPDAKVKYNPFKFTSFVTVDGEEPVLNARLASFSTKEGVQVAL